MIAVGARLHQWRMLLIIVVVTIMMMVMEMVMVDLRLTVRPMLAGRRGGTGVSGGGGGGMVVLAQTPDGDTGLRPPGAAHALRRGRPVMVVIVLARRQAAALDQEQRATVRVQQRAHVLQDLVTQRPHVQLVAYVFHLRTDGSASLKAVVRRKRWEIQEYEKSRRLLKAGGQGRGSTR